MPPKEEVSTQVLISPTFCEDLVSFLRDPGLDFENIWFFFKTEKNPIGTIYGEKTTRLNNEIILEVCKEER